MIANAFGGKPVHAWYEPVIWAKGYEMMSCYEGLVSNLRPDLSVLR